MHDGKPEPQPFRAIASRVVDLIVLGEYRFPMRGCDTGARVPHVYANTIPDIHPADDDTALEGVLDRIQYEIGQCALEQGAITFNGWRAVPTHADSQRD